MKDIYFSSKYRPKLGIKFSLAKEIATTRLNDDKGLSVGDRVRIREKESGAILQTGVVSRVASTRFQDFLSTVLDPEGTYKMYNDYYGRPIDPQETVKQVTISVG